SRSTGKRRARDEESERPRLRDPAEPGRKTSKRRARDEESERPRLKDPAEATRKTAKRDVARDDPASEGGSSGSKGRRSGRRRKEARSQRATGATEAKDPKGPKDPEEDTHRFDVKSLAEASQGKSARLKSQRLEQTFGASATQEGTRRFDPDALAAASSRPVGRRPLLLPALALGALSVVAVGALSLMREDSLPPPPPPPPGPSPTDVAQVDTAASGAPLADVQQQARALEAREDYAAALTLYRGLPPAVRAAEAESLRAVEARLSELSMFARAAEQTLEAAEPFRSAPPNDPQQAAQLQRILAKLEGLVESATPTQLGSPAARRLQRALEELALTRTRPLDPKGPVRRREPPARTQRFAEQAKQGAQVVEQTRQRILAEKAQIEERRRAREARAQAESRRTPLTVVVDEIRHEGCLVGEFDERGFTLKAEARTLGFRWREALRDHPELALKVRQFAVRADSARDQLDFGRWCLEHRQWKEAQQAFSRAVVLDGRLKDRVPDVTAIARSSRVFRGKVERTAGSGSLTLRYDFRLAAHNADWTPAGNAARGGVRDGAYRLRGKGLAVSALKTVGWENHLSLHATLGAAQPGSMPLIGLTLKANSPEEESWLLGLDLGQMQVLLLRRTGKSMKVIERRELRAGEEDPILALEVMGDRLLARVNGRAMFLRSISVPWGRTRLLLGVRSLNKGGSCQADFSRCQVVGAVRQEWIRKAFGEFDDHLRAFLARSEDLDVFARPEQRPQEPKLSCEDEFGLERVPAEARAHERRGRVKLGLGKPLDLLAAANAFAKAVELAPNYAAALYRRGLALERLGQRSLAIDELERAVRACPHFYEARAALARVLAGSERLTEAEAAVRKALEDRPDHAPARSALALIYFRRGDLERAREQLDLALALDPSDEGVRSFRRNVTNVLRGPPWETTYSARTRHYQVKSDISQARADEYARELETIRASYERFFQVTERPQAKRATVLIFDTEEGFQSYAELSTDDRVESLLGCYLRRYDQLLLYEDKDDATRAETRRVLYHEAFHQFLEPLIPDVPFWLSEGMAEYFGSTRIEEGQVVDRGAKLPARLRDLRKFVSERGSPLSIPGLMRESPSEFYSGPVAVKYAQAWAVVHFLMHGAKDEWRARFVRYLRALLAGKSPRSALVAWKGVDWQAFEKAWWAHVKGL
ncbi:MAG TPA: hypothetical protein DEA08_01320, partial [Planctomycetes bacterium]|nr:hypothetical protein [Planctomycetota bacterium]